jgi:protein TonB
MLDKTPKRVDTTAVEYPKRMLKLGVEGDVRLLVLILDNGEVRVEKVLNSTNNFFSESAVAAASRFIYETPLRNGKPVKARFVLPIPFRIVK